MAIPISYNIRNLRLRKGATVMTALGIALTVTIAIFIMALLAGLRDAFATTGDARNVLVLRKGSTSELAAGGVSRDAMQVLKDLPGIAKNSQGDPLVSGENILVIVLPRKDGTGDVNVTIRFLAPVGLEMRPKVKLVAGRWFTPGQREVVVSKSIHERFAHTNLGDSIFFGKGNWTVVGVFDSGSSAHESEIWGDINQIASDLDRSQYSSVLMQATDPQTAEALKNRVSDDQRLKLNGMLESDYYAKQTSSGAPIKFVGTVVAIIMAIGSCFAAMNTMYAAVAYRAREIATLRIIGFSRPSILTSFVFESLLLSLLGALAGIVLMLPFNGMTTGTSNPVTFSEAVFSLRMTPGVVTTAVIFALVMGLFGGLAPAWHAARQNIVGALRD
ncbi:MAG TPA: ABC transporter permease [Terriglobales bacterium]|jgi:putative ABC transport system permease protein|nr:ABC transporter permease [Terriglobales bacterium]